MPPVWSISRPEIGEGVPSKGGGPGTAGGCAAGLLTGDGLPEALVVDESLVEESFELRGPAVKAHTRTTMSATATDPARANSHTGRPRSSSSYSSIAW